MTLDSNTTSAILKQDGNALVVIPKAQSQNGVIAYSKIPQHDIGTSIVYRKPNEQAMVEFFLENTMHASLKINVIHRGNVIVQKIDADTGMPLPNTTLRFEYNGMTEDIITNTDGFAEISGIPQGTQVRIAEVTAPNGFVNKGEVKTVIVEPNQTVSIQLDNKAQQGLLKLSKTGKRSVAVTQTESEYEIIYSFVYHYRPLANVPIAL